jgi:hypothetical protein
LVGIRGAGSIVMRSVSRLTILPLVAGLLIGAGACAAAAAGAAGAVGAVYYSERGAESMVSAPVEKTGEAARTAFKEFKITETKSRSDQEAGKTRQVIEGTMADREVTVTIAAEGNRRCPERGSTRVQSPTFRSGHLGGVPDGEFGRGQPTDGT